MTSSHQMKKEANEKSIATQSDIQEINREHRLCIASLDEEQQLCIASLATSSYQMKKLIENNDFKSLDCQLENKYLEMAQLVLCMITPSNEFSTGTNYYESIASKEDYINYIPPSQGRASHLWKALTIAS